jgi:hypothetical protein
MEDLQEERGYLFTYPAVYPWLAGIGALAFLALGVLCLAYGGDDVSPWVAAYLLVAAALYGAAWALTQGHVLLGEQAITLTRFGRPTRIEYAEVRALEQRLFAQAMVVRGQGRSIWIERQLEGYPLLQDMLVGALQPEQGGAQAHRPAGQREGAR